MKAFELIHDSLAKTIFDNYIGEYKVLIDIQNLLSNRYDDYKNRDVLLKEEDLQYITPFLSKLRLDDELQIFIKKSEEAIQKAKRKSRNRTISIITFLSILTAGLGISLFFTNKASSEARKRAKQTQSLYIASLAKDENNSPKKQFNDALRLARLAYNTYPTPNSSQQLMAAFGNMYEKQVNFIFRKQIADKKEIEEFAVSKDEKFIATFARNNTVTIWDKQFKKIKEIKLPQHLFDQSLTHPDSRYNGIIYKPIFTPKSNQMLIRYANNSYVLINIQSEKIIEFSGDNIKDLTLLSKHSLILVHNKNNTYSIWDFEKQRIDEFKQKKVINLEVSPKGNFLLLQYEDQTADIYQLDVQKIVKSIENTLAVKFCLNEKNILAYNREGIQLIPVYSDYIKKLPFHDFEEFYIEKQSQSLAKYSIVDTLAKQFFKYILTESQEKNGTKINTRVFGPVDDGRTFFHKKIEGSNISRIYAFHSSNTLLIGTKDSTVYIVNMLGKKPEIIEEFADHHINTKYEAIAPTRDNFCMVNTKTGELELWKYDYKNPSFKCSLGKAQEDELLYFVPKSDLISITKRNFDRIQLWNQEGRNIGNMKKNGTDIKPPRFSYVRDLNFVFVSLYPAYPELYAINDLSFPLVTFNTKKENLKDSYITKNGRKVVGLTISGKLKIWEDNSDGIFQTKATNVAEYDLSILASSQFFTTHSLLSAQVWDIKGQQVFDFNNEIIKDLIVSPKNDLILVSELGRSGDQAIADLFSKPRHIKLYKPSGELVFQRSFNSAISDFSFSKDGQFILLVFQNDRIKVLDTRGEIIGKINDLDYGIAETQFTSQNDVVISTLPNKSSTLLDELSNTSTDSFTIQKGWDWIGEWLRPDSKKKTKEYGIEYFSLNGVKKGGHKRHTEEIETIAVSANGKYIASGSSDSTIIIQELNTGKNIDKLSCPEPVKQLWLTNENNLLIKCERILNLWSIKEGKVISSFDFDSIRVNISNVSVSPEMDFIIISNQTLNNLFTSTLCNFKGEKIRQFLSTESLSYIDFSSDGKHFISRGDVPQLWDINGNLLGELQSSYSIGSLEDLQFSPDGKKIIGVFLNGAKQSWLLPEGIIEWMDRHEIPALSQEELEKYNINDILKN